MCCCSDDIRQYCNRGFLTLQRLSCNQELDSNMPAVVKEFKAKIKDADAALIASPEYNCSIPGFLKNPIDWASKPYGDNAFEGKLSQS